MRLFALCAMCTLFLCPVMAASYVGVHVGPNFTSAKNSENVGHKVGATYGLKLENGLRTELALTYHKNNFKTQYNSDDKSVIISKEYHTHYALSMMANVIYDLNQIQVAQIVPYVGIGAGYCQNNHRNEVKFDLTSDKKHTQVNRFAYQAIAGAKYDMNANYSLALQYHYFVGQAHTKDHSVAMSVLRNF